MPVAWDQLSCAQKRVIQHIKGPMLVFAGPGTGKTEVLTQRVAYLIKQGILPEEILAITFTKKARNEMIDRLSEFEGLEDTDFNVSTLHGTAIKIMGEYGVLRNYLAASDETKMVFDDAVSDILDNRSYAERKELFSWVELQKAKNVRCHECEDGDNKNLYIRYEELLDYNDVQDLSGVVLNVVDLLNSLGRAYVPKNKHLLVDEYQDINYTEYDFIKHLLKDAESIFFVGDDDQSIYGWRGADPQILHDFKKDFGGKIETIEHSRRCTGYILNGAIEIVNKCKIYHPKKLSSVKGDGNKINVLVSSKNDKEAEWITNKILEFVKDEEIELKDIAIITKQLNRADEINISCLRKGIKVNFWRPNQIFRDPYVRNIISVSRLMCDKSDNLALRQVLSSIKKFGIGEKGINNLRKVAEKCDVPLWEILRNRNHLKECRSWGKKYATFSDMIVSLEKEIENKPVHKCVDIFSKIYLQKKTANVEQLYEFSKILPDESSFEDFIQEFNNKRGLDFGTADIDLEENAVNIMSLHASKGLGFKVVFVIGMEKDFFPNPEQDIDEQRRLCYVAMTRAKENLYMCYSQNITGPVAQGFRAYGYSPFLLEIPEAYRLMIPNP
jgi:DNA helicase-2/ATP-dependent DNA helicase PcrA